MKNKKLMIQDYSCGQYFFVHEARSDDAGLGTPNRSMGAEPSPRNISSFP
jgi:hypothetical protein